MLAALIALTLIPSNAGAAETPARMSDAFVDSIGVNTHIHYTDTAYDSEFGLVKQRLGELGIRHIREYLLIDRPDQYERFNELAGMGIKPTLILGHPREGLPILDELISILRTELRGTPEAVEGPNEIDVHGDASWLPQLAVHQQHLYSAIKSDPNLAALPVIGPSLIQRSNQEALGDISGMLDFGNIHAYADGLAPEGNLATHLERAANNSATKPVIATEAGYHNALNWQQDVKPVSEDAAAIYMPRLFLDYFRRGVARTFSYELLDAWSDPDRGERESNFGLLRNDLSPKPAFTALRNTIEILKDPGPAFSPLTLNYALDDRGDDLREVLLQKRDGSFYLALWRASAVWDPATRTPLDAPTERVTVDFGRQILAAEQYLPNYSNTPIGAPRASGGQMTVGVGPRVTILKITLGKTLRKRIKLWVSRQRVPEGGQVTVKGLLPLQTRGKPVRVRIQRWKRGNWRTVGGSRTSRNGRFRKKIHLKKGRYGHASRLRVVAPRKTKPSRSVRIRIRKLR